MSKFSTLVTVSVMTTFITVIILLSILFVPFINNNNLGLVTFYVQVLWDSFDIMVNQLCFMMQHRFFGIKYYGIICYLPNCLFEKCFEVNAIKKMEKMHDVTLNQRYSINTDHKNKNGNNGKSGKIIDTSNATKSVSQVGNDNIVYQ